MAGVTSVRGASGPARPTAPLLAPTQGIDFKGVRTVVNVHPPPTVEAYVHRVGRTGRAGAPGAAVSLLSPQDASLAAVLETALSGALRPSPSSSSAAPAHERSDLLV